MARTNMVNAARLADFMPIETLISAFFSGNINTLISAAENIGIDSDQLKNILNIMSYTCNDEDIVIDDAFNKLNISVGTYNATEKAEVSANLEPQGRTM
ncbi:MAG: hypothetical protein R3Y21_04805 [Mycoplasmatota bacterium]